MVESASGGISRRRFLEGVAGLTVLAACGGNGDDDGGGGAAATTTVVTPTRRLSGDLRILQWSHFVPQHDTWFDPFAKAWGTQVGVNVTVDHIDQAELFTRAGAEIQAREGHDLIEFISPPSNLEPAVLDLADVNQEAVRRHGNQISLCTKSSYNPTTRKYYGFCHGYAPDPGDYRRSLWERVGLPNGPSTYQELLDGGTRVKQNGVQLGIGMSNEIDSNMAARALMWSFGASIQDERENVVLNSPQTIEAVDYMVRLFRGTMTDEVFGWNAASNNQGLIAGNLSYILNSISAYRSAQTANPEVADDVFFTAPLKGPGGIGLASEHAIMVYVIPTYARNPDAAKEFLLNLVGNYSQATNNSKLYTLPAWPSTVPQANEWLANDPFGSKPANKLALLRDAERWSTNIGHPGPANAAEGVVFSTFVIPQMMAKAARGQLSPRDAVIEAEGRVKTIFQQWRERKLVGGTS
ncbi:MAG: extracellular solute-binding protein [Actinomycetota bacterium]|nr:extracellular solute-binding protein [Actinomycetota bacterium]